MNTIIYGKDPISLEKINIYDWLNESPDNILLIFDKNNSIDFTRSRTSFNKKNKEIKNLNNNEIIYCLKRSFIQTPTLKNIYNQCLFSNNIFLPKESYKSKNSYFNIGYYLNKNILIPIKDLTQSKIEKNNIFKIQVSTNNQFINKESLLLSQFGLFKNPTFKIPKNIPNDEKERLRKLHKIEKTRNNIIDKKNIPYKKDVYFEDILAKALIDYSFQWDAPVNLYLRQGESYFETDFFKQYYIRYGNTIDEAIENVKLKVEDLDRAFLEASSKHEDSRVTYFRGMKIPFQKLINIGDTEIIHNFISVSTSFNVALRFSGVPMGSKCCIYKIYVDKGVPYIDMINTTKYKHEKEILLPRNLLFKLTKIQYITYGPFKIPIIHINVSLRYNDQFKITNVCKHFYVGNLNPYNPSYFSKNELNKNYRLNYPELTNNNGEKIKINTQDINDDVQNHSVPSNGKKCPKGYRKNKINGLYEFYDPNIKKTKTKKVKKEINSSIPIKKRCPNGTRKNKITRNCEAK